MDTKVVRTYCPICDFFIGMEVPKKERLVFPFEFVHYHGDPPHALISYIDENYLVQKTDNVKEFHGVDISLDAPLRRKTVVTGHYGVGKTSTIRKVLRDEFDPVYVPTLTLGLQERSFVLGDDIIVSAQMWETPGQRSSMNVAMRQKFFTGADAALLVCDVTRKNSFEELKDIVEDLQYYSSDCQIYGIANKIDLDHKRVVSEDEVKQIGEALGIEFFEISCRTRDNLDSLITSWLWMLIRSVTGPEKYR